MRPHTIPRHVTKLLNCQPSPKLLSCAVPLLLRAKKPAEFASALAHEVRNPLSNINLALEMLKSTALDDDQKTYLDIIMRGSGRINDLVSDLLTYYQTDESQSEKYSIHQLLDEVLAMTEDRIMLKNVVVSKCYTSLDCKIFVNKQKIKIALTNIIINALDAMPPDKGQLKLVTKSINDKCVLEIEDNGIGISKENLKNIFKPDFSNRPGGMGLGLSTTMDILLSNHARVVVQSEEGKGTLFILSFDRIECC